jgi:hypothetical protein
MAGHGQAGGHAAAQPNPGPQQSDKEIGVRPPVFSGDRGQYETWWFTVMNYLAMNQVPYNTDVKKIGFVLTLLQGGDAGIWGAHYWKSQTNSGANTYTDTWTEFVTKLNDFFQKPDAENEAEFDLENIKQNGRPAADFNIEFRRLASLAGITNDRNLIKLYRKGLDYHIAKRIDERENGAPDTIAAWYPIAITFDNIRRKSNALYGTNPKRKYVPPHRQNKPSNGNYYRTPPPMYNTWNNPPKPDPWAMDIDYINWQNNPYNAWGYQNTQPETWNGHQGYNNQEPQYEEQEEEEAPVNEDPENEMQLNAVFTPIQKLRFKNWQCIGCGSPNHKIATCPNPDSNLSRNRPPPRNGPKPQFKPNFQSSSKPGPSKPFKPSPFKTNNRAIELQAMIQDLSLEDQMNFQDMYMTEKSLQTMGDFQ